MSSTRYIPRPETVVAGLVIVAVAAVTIAVADGKVVVSGLVGAGELPEPDWATFWMILIRNSTVALGLFSGAVTLGISTGVFLLLVGGMLGWSMATSVAALGVAETLLRCWAYTPVELMGFALAGAAGLTPAFGLLRRMDGAPQPAGAGLSRALRTLALSLAVLVVAAAVETLSIALTAQRLDHR